MNNLNLLNRNEMKKIMAGGAPGCYRCGPDDRCGIMRNSFCVNGYQAEPCKYSDEGCQIMVE